MLSWLDERMHISASLADCRNNHAGVSVQQNPTLSTTHGSLQLSMSVHYQRKLLVVPTGCSQAVQSCIHRGMTTPFLVGQGSAVVIGIDCKLLQVLE